jgi:hypothetical protein
MSTDSGVSILDPRDATHSPGMVGGVRYKDGQVCDRWRRSEQDVEAQRALAAEITEMLAEIRERAPEIEPGRSVGPRLHRRLEVVQGSFRRLMECDSRILAEFEEYRDREELRRRQREGSALEAIAATVALHGGHGNGSAAA